MTRTKINLSLMLMAVDLPAFVLESIFLVHHTSGQAHIDRIGRTSFAYFPILLLANYLIFHRWTRLPAVPAPPGAGPLLLPEGEPGFWQRLDTALAYVVGSFLLTVGGLSMLAMEWQLSARNSVASPQFKLSITAICVGIVLVWRGRRLQNGWRKPRRRRVSSAL
jgi:hypothetical protein